MKHAFPIRRRRQAPKPLRLRLCPRPQDHPPYWVPLAGLPVPGWGSDRRLYVSSYVLQALGIPHRITRRQEILVPVLYAQRAAKNLAEYQYELAHPKVPHVAQASPWASLALVVVLPLVLVYALYSSQAFRIPGFPHTLQDAATLLGFDNVRVLLVGEWARTVTALFVHADLGHLVANAGFALFFCRLLATHTGPGLALFLTIFAGALGNALTLPFRQGYVLSYGFSTALFACIGSLSGFVARFSRSGALWPLACGAALLALLGTEGEDTDYTAHVCGLLCGMGCGALAALAARRWPVVLKAPWQAGLGLASLALPLWAFWARLG